MEVLFQEIVSKEMDAKWRQFIPDAKATDWRSISELPLDQSTSAEKHFSTLMQWNPLKDNQKQGIGDAKLQQWSSIHEQQKARFGESSFSNPLAENVASKFPRRGSKDDQDSEQPVANDGWRSNDKRLVKNNRVRHSDDDQTEQQYKNLEQGHRDWRRDDKHARPEIDSDSDAPAGRFLKRQQEATRPILPHRK